MLRQIATNNGVLGGGAFHLDGFLEKTGQAVNRLVEPIALIDVGFFSDEAVQQLILDILIDASADTFFLVSIK